MNLTQAREEICRVGLSLFQRGYVHATAGNISIQLDEGTLITPTDACLGFLDPASIALVNHAGQQTSGDPASKTLKLHQSIYKACTEHAAPARCIIHTHSTHCVALSLQSTSFKGPTGHAELLPPITPYFVMKVGHVPHISYHRPGAPEAAQAVVHAIARYAERGIALRAVMLSRLGPNVWHQTPAAAMAVLEELEETARLCLLSHGPTSALEPVQIDALRSTFKAQW
jgi:3-dehydro-4-phosphotetronate decarboxylase